MNENNKNTQEMPDPTFSYHKPSNKKDFNPTAVEPIEKKKDKPKNRKKG